MRVGHFEKRQHDRHAHKIGCDYTLSERNVLGKLLQFTMNIENVLSRRGTLAKWKYLLARNMGREPL